MPKRSQPNLEHLHSLKNGRTHRTSINSNRFSSKILNCASRSRYVVGAGGEGAGAAVSAIVAAQNQKLWGKPCI